MPLVQLVTAARVIDVYQRFVVQRAGAHLVVARREQLYHTVPEGLILRLVIFEAERLEPVDDLLHNGFARVVHTVDAHIIQRKRFAVDLVHRAAGVGDGADLVCIVFLPPVKRRVDIDGNEDHTHELALVAAALAEADGERKVVFAQDLAAVFVIIAVAFRPAVERVSRPAYRVLKVHHRGAHQFNHGLSPLSFVISIAIPIVDIYSNIHLFDSININLPGSFLSKCHPAMISAYPS